MNARGANADPAAEPPIDHSLAHWTEQRALEIAHDKAAGAGDAALLDAITALQAKRAALTAERAAHLAEMTRKSHARGEIYSAARVAAINAMMPDQASMEREVRALYERQPDARAVLEAHALVAFGLNLEQQRSWIKLSPPDVQADLRRMAALEEAFARAWVAVVGDPKLEARLRARRIAAQKQLRSSRTAMLVVAEPALSAEEAAAIDPDALAKAWDKLDALCGTLGVRPLSQFIGLEADPCEPAARVLASLSALQRALHTDSTLKLPGKKALRSSLTALCAAAERRAGLQAPGGLRFEVDL